ncbi:hypothetical protein RRG08_045972 [Elysia crispata]|uniref:Uncharacterized protein n=1 Tax=Elysia crispata TaxID=231223 RepID=A0AAE1ARJ3_9GAST|nr:hypothetical protein RRG08_045972 [Elysia crispata]
MDPWRDYSRETLDSGDFSRRDWTGSNQTYGSMERLQQRDTGGCYIQDEIVSLSDYWIAGEATAERHWWLLYTGRDRFTIRLLDCWRGYSRETLVVAIYRTRSFHYQITGLLERLQQRDTGGCYIQDETVSLSDYWIAGEATAERHWWLLYTGRDLFTIRLLDCWRGYSRETLVVAIYRTRPFHYQITGLLERLRHKDTGQWSLLSILNS